MRLSRILGISRPVLWPVAPILFLVPFAYFRQGISLVAFMHLLSLSFPYCFFLFGINDIYDHETDIINPRKGGAQGAVLKKNEFGFVFGLSVIFAALIMLISIITLNPLNILMTSLLLLVSYYYSAPPRLKEIVPLDSVSNALIIFFIVGIGYSYIQSSVPLMIIHAYPFLLGIISIHIFSTIMDYTPDKKVHVRTFATVFGKKNAAWAAIIVMMITIFLLWNQHVLINIFLFSVLILYFFPLFNPSEKIARFIFIIIFIIFIVISIAFLTAKSSFPAFVFLNYFR